jgi:hypothetical protein
MADSVSRTSLSRGGDIEISGTDVSRTPHDLNGAPADH